MSLTTATLKAALAALSGLLLLAAAACSAPAVVDGPPDIRYGQDVCDECGMIIGDERFAAAYMTAAGEVRRFDDIGDMMRYDARDEEDVRVYWVHDFDTHAWLRAPNASFVVSESLITPMGHGLLAVGLRTRAEELAAETGGRVLSFDALRDRYAQGRQP